MPPNSRRRTSLRRTELLPPYKDKAQAYRPRGVPSLRYSRNLDLAPVLPESHLLNMAMTARQHWHTQNDNKFGRSAAGMVQMTSVRLRGRQLWSRATRK